MLHRKLHLEQINRFHDVIDAIDKQIDKELNEDVKAELLRTYFKLTKTWRKVDDYTEALKHELDMIEL